MNPQAPKPFLEQLGASVKPTVSTEVAQATIDFFAQSPKRRLPESIFVQNFLAFFCKETPASEYSTYVNAWIEVAGSPSAEIDLVDEYDQVTVTIPPIFNTSISYQRLDWNYDRSIQAAVDNFGFQATNNKPLANAMLANQLQESIRRGQVPTVDRLMQQKWVAVYKHFKRPDLASVIEKELGGGGMSGPVGSSGGLEFEF